MDIAKIYSYQQLICIIFIDSTSTSSKTWNKSDSTKKIIAHIISVVILSLNLHKQINDLYGNITCRQLNKFCFLDVIFCCFL